MCVQLLQYNSSAAVQQNKKKKEPRRGFELTYSRKKHETKIRKSRDRGFKLTLCLSRIERSTAEPKGKVVTTCRHQEGNFDNRRSTILAAALVLSPGIARVAMWVGLDAVARSRGLGGLGGARDSQLFLGYIITGMFSKINLDSITTTTTTEEHYII